MSMPLSTIPGTLCELRPNWDSPFSSTGCFRPVSGRRRHKPCAALADTSHRRSLRCGDGYAFLLAGIGDVRHRSALHVAFPAQVIELGAPMQRAAIVPNNQVIDTPSMCVDELPLGGMGDEVIDKRASI